MTAQIQPRVRSAANWLAAGGSNQLQTQPWTIFHWFLALLVLTFVWRLQDLFPIFAKMQLVSLSILGALGTFLLYEHATGFKAASEKKVYKLALIILVLMVLSVPFSIFMGNSFRFILEDHIKTFLLMVMLMAGVRSLKNIERFALVQIVGASIYSTWVIINVRMSGARLGGLVYYDSNDLGMLIICTLPLCLHFLRKEQSAFLRLLAAATLPIFMIAFIRCGSRGGFLGLLVVSLYMLFSYKVVRSRTRFLVFAIGAAAFVTLAGDTFWELMRTLLNPTQDYNWSGNSETGRMEVWKRGMGYMLQRPFTGVGVFNFYVAEGSLSALSQQQQFGEGLKWSAPHNSFVQIGAELGIFGLIAFLLMLWHARRDVAAQIVSVAESTRYQSLGQAFGACIVGYAVTGFFLSQAYSAFLYTMIGVMIAFMVTRETDSAASVKQPKVTTFKPRGRGGLVVGPSAVSK